MTGLPFPDTAERFVLMEELLQLAAHMWDGDHRPFDGPRHRLEQPISNPQPIARPRLLIGGMGEQRTLPLVARYGDACNLFDIPDGGATLQHKLEVLARACDAIGRDPHDIEVTLSSRLGSDESSEAFTDRCGQLAKRGIQHIVLVTSGPWSQGELDVIFEAWNRSACSTDRDPGYPSGYRRGGGVVRGVGAEIADTAFQLWLAEGRVDQALAGEQGGRRGERVV
jgi:alkanesulfonate monooxygenase SsuD/methylene tetrahydromethanopterin reductase-like flavin-dependent oxidoreductase (luciferase family)